MAPDYAVDVCHKRGRGYYALTSRFCGFSASGCAIYSHCCFDPDF